MKGRNHVHLRECRVKSTSCQLSNLTTYFDRRGVHNFSHPRTDAVVIMAVIDAKANKILLGRNVRQFRAIFDIFDTYNAFVATIA